MEAGMDVMVVGAGAAGLVAAWRAAARGLRVLVLEGGERVALKVRISGGGRCNVTHAGGAAGVLSGFPNPMARFLREPLRRFTPEDLLALLAQAGIETEAREDGRIFPVGGPGTAHAVADALLARAEGAGARVWTGTRVVGLEGGLPHLSGVRLADGRLLTARAVVLATGGASYPQTGTRGEGLGWLKALGLPVAGWRPALAPIPLAVPHPAWEGVALRGVALRLQVQEGGKRQAEAEGDLVFTRGGISGPAALALSEAVEMARREGGGWLTCALDARSEEALDAHLLELQGERPSVLLKTVLHAWFPERMLEPILQAEGLGGRMGDLPRAARRKVARLVTAFPLGRPAQVPLEKGEVCAGGLSLKAVDPGTCRVKGWDNLHVAGELLDIHGPVGGYNLQAAFSTGFVAGESVLV